MAPERYAGTAGEVLRRQDEKRGDSANAVDARAIRMDLMTRLPAGRALDHEHLVWMLDQQTTRSWAIVMRERLLTWAMHNLPPGILVTRDELEQLREHSVKHPTRPGTCPGIPEWPLSR